MSEMDWMYDSLTERFGETLGERQKVVDALLIANAVAGAGALGAGNPEGTISIARFILDEWSKHSDAEDSDTITDDPEEKGEPVVLDIGMITEPDISLMKYGTHTFPEGSRWLNRHWVILVFTGGKFFMEEAGFVANTNPDSLPFIRIYGEEN